MQELIMKMVLCLVIALALGFFIGWFLKRAIDKEQYGTLINRLQDHLSKNKIENETQEDELSLLKEQLLTTKENLDTASHRYIELEEHLTTYQSKLSILESNIKDRDSIIEQEQKEKNILKIKLDEKHQKLENMISKSANQDEIIDRVKEHHLLLKQEVMKLTNEKKEADDKHSIMIETFKKNEKKLQEEKIALEQKFEESQFSSNKKNITTLDLENKIKENKKLHTIISKQKEKETKIVDENRAKEGKIAELESILNEKKIASIELHNKIKEINNLKQRNNLLTEQLKEKSTREGLDFMKFAKKALYYIPESSEEIRKNADKVIKEYKDRR